MNDIEKQGAQRILKVTTLLGGASLVNVLLGMLRVKILAVQLGPALFGTMSLYSNFISTIGSVTSLGIGQSAVRDIAEAANSGDEQKIAKKIAVLHRVVWVTGIFGFFITMSLALPGSRWVFGNYDHAWAIAILGVIVLLTLIQSGQSALLSGLRRIGDLAKINVIGGVLSTILAIVLLLLLGAKGIVPFLIAVAVGQLAASWWYARKVKVANVQVSWRECLVESREMVHLGLTIVVSGVALTVSTLVILMILREHEGESAVGLYQSALTISSIYVGFILQGMSGDYFPKLAGVASDRVLRNQVVNEQAEMAMLLAVPGLVAALVLSSILIPALYSARFDGASDILKWQILGMLGRIVSWPMGFLLLARGDKTAYLWCELTTVILHVFLVWLGVQYWGAIGAGMAMAGEYLFYVVLIGWVTNHFHGYTWNRATRNVILVGSSMVAVAFGLTFITAPVWRYASGALMLSIVIGWSLLGMLQRLGLAHVVEVMQKVAGKLRLPILQRGLSRITRKY